MDVSGCIPIFSNDDTTTDMQGDKEMLLRFVAGTITASLVALLLAEPAHARRPRAPELFKIKGDSQSLAAVIFPMKEAFQSETKMPLLITAEVSPLKGLEEVDRGDGDALVVAMSFEELNRLATDADLKRRNKQLTMQSVLLEELSYKVIVHPRNPVRELSAKELRRIFSGRYRDWGDVDGQKGPLAVVWGEWSTGAAWVLADRVMEDEQRIKEIIPAESIADIVAKVADNPNAIGIVPSSALTPAVKTVDTPELKIEGPIIMVTVGFPMPKHMQLLKLIRGEGRPNIGY